MDHAIVVQHRNADQSRTDYVERVAQTINAGWWRQWATGPMDVLILVGPLPSIPQRLALDVIGAFALG
jgi:hypothetical protein